MVVLLSRARVRLRGGEAGRSDRPDSAQRAIRAAREMLESFTELAHSWKERKGNRAVEISVGDRKPPLGVARLSPPIGHLMERPVMHREAYPMPVEMLDKFVARQTTF